MTSNDIELQKIATGQWELFKTLVGENSINRALIVALRHRGLSYGQIETRTGIERCNARLIYRRWHKASIRG